MVKTTQFIPQTKRTTDLWKMTVIVQNFCILLVEKESKGGALQVPSTPAVSMDAISVSKQL